MDQTAKRTSVFEAATEVFSRYGFRRTAMNDVAEAAGISRPALYLLFDNKEDLFRQLATHRQKEALEAAAVELAGSSTFPDRMIKSILAFEQVFYEPVSESPHGAELMDVSQSIASEDMIAGLNILFDKLSAAIDAAVESNEADLSASSMTARQFVELLMSSIGGQKKNATSKDDFREKVRNVTSIFMASISRVDSA